MLPKWDELPSQFHNGEVREYYDILKRKRASLIAKRVLDITAAFVLLLIFSPVFIVLAGMIKIDSRGPVFYRQSRVTTGNKDFLIYKFRTMEKNADRKGPLLTENDDARITRIGKTLRKYRIDELPQLLNTITGDMSFVGARPEVRKYVDRYSNEMLATLLMPAGITSTASICYKDENEIMEHYKKKGGDREDAYINEVLPRKMEYNLDYLKTFRFRNDVKIMGQTVAAMVKHT